MLGDYDFIKAHKDLMYTDSKNVWHAILVTTKALDYGILYKQMVQVMLDTPHLLEKVK